VPAPLLRSGGNAVRDGVLSMAPLLVAYAPFALVIGATAAANGGAFAGWTGSWLVYGGSAQLAAMRTLGHSGPLLAVATGLLINARLVVYSAGLARRWPNQPRWFRIAAAPLIIDPTYAAAERHAAGCDDAREQRRFFIAAGRTLGIGWSAAMAFGAAAGARRDHVRLEIVVPLCLLALIGDGLRSAGSRSVVVASAAIAAGTVGLPAGGGLLAAIAGGCIAGSMHDRRGR
jgi:predicted branched-subunit amino acid permease